MGVEAGGGGARGGQNSATPKIIITCFFVDPCMLKSKPTAIRGRGMDSCPETPKTVSVSRGAHLLQLERGVGGGVRG